MCLATHIDNIETLLQLYDIFAPPVQRHKWLGISYKQDKALSEGIYPMSELKPHPSALKLLNEYR